MGRLTTMPTSSRVAHRPAADAKGVDDGRPAGTNFSVLVVDDDDLVRGGVERSLVRLGYNAFVAAGPTEALALLRSSDHAIDLLFTDIRMPGGIDGFELARMVRQEFPHVAVLLTTGFAGSPPKEAGERILYKPYKLVDLAAAIRESLEARDRGV
jgi:CheY-like chemotaxis protein